MSSVIPTNFVPVAHCLQHRIVLVTGAAGGIGAVASKTCARYGATVILLDRDVKGLEAVYDEIEDAGYPAPAIYPMDFEGATEDDYTGLANTLEKEFGQLDGLLHNAARRDPLTPLWKIELDDWFGVLQVNLNAPFMLTRACLELLNASQSASIIFTTDHQAREHHAYWGAYGVSKHALDELMRILADELENQSSIRVNAIDPGSVRTNMRARSHPGLDPGKMTEPEAIMNSYLYLLSDQNHNSGKLFLAQNTQGT